MGMALGYFGEYFFNFFGSRKLDGLKLQSKSLSSLLRFFKAGYRFTFLRGPQSRHPSHIGKRLF